MLSNRLRVCGACSCALESEERDDHDFNENPGEPCDGTDGRVDIWSFGIGLYRILTGEFPFTGEHPAALMYAIINETRIGFPDYVPERMRAIITDCLEKDPNDRPRDFGLLAAELESFQAELREESDAGTTIVSNVSALADRSSKRNPYLNRVMIKHASDFFGREKEVRKIYSRLDAPQPQSISVVGERRIGKSSLLNYVYNRQNRKAYMQNYDSAIFVYLDFQNMVDNDVPKFIDLLFNVFSFETGERTKYTARPKALDQLKDVIQELHEAGKRIVIMMDEFRADHAQREVRGGLLLVPEVAGQFVPGRVRHLLPRGITADVSQQGHLRFALLQHILEPAAASLQPRGGARARDGALGA